MSVSACFDNLINVKGNCPDQVVPTSGIWMDDGGINMDFLNSIIEAPFNSGGDLFNAKYSLAIKQISNRINSHFADKMEVDYLLGGARLGHMGDNYSLVSAEAKLKGIEMEICNTNSFVDLFINTITLTVNHTGNVPVIVYDVLTGQQLDSLTVACTSGIPSTLIVNKLYKSNRKKLDIILVYDASAIDSIQTYVTRSGCFSCSNNAYYFNNSYLRANGVKIDSADDKYKQELEIISETGGMSINYSVQCNQQDWLCSFVNLLALPLYYKVSEEIYDYALKSKKRLNTNTLKSDALKEAKEEYAEKYSEELSNILSNIQLPSDDKCFRCKRRSMHKIILP